MARSVGSRVLVWVLLACGAVASPVASGEPEYTAEIERYRETREERLRRPTGWLSLIGLFWLEDGPNPIGADESLPIVLPADASPARAGLFRLDGDGVWFLPHEGVNVTVADRPVPDRVLRDDRDGEPDILELGRLSMHLIRRGDRVALRVKDPESPARTGFAGLDYFPIDASYRVEARFERFDEPRTVEIPTVAGTTASMMVPGRLTFEIGGRGYTLEPLVSEPDETELFLIFRDETTGRETYGAGRYLYTDLTEGVVVIDFNRSYNPPCAFTRHATCPLPPRANRLPVEIRAGEMAYGDH